MNADDFLWKALHAWRRDGIVFKRHARIGPYVADFLCPAQRLIVEVDVMPLRSASARAEQAVRSRVLRKRGYRILRFWSDHVLSHPDGVLGLVALALEEPHGKTEVRASRPEKRVLAG